MTAIPTVQSPGLIQFYNWIVNPLSYMATHYGQYGDAFRARGTLGNWVFLSHDEPVQPQRRGITLSMKGGVDMVYQGKQLQPKPIEV